jgi:uncharacterized tellurite resistance protein B-like protein
MKHHILTITDLLLGAAYADKRLEGQEKDKIRSLLSKLLGGKTIPAEVEARFREFSPAAFDVDAAGKSVSHLGKDRRKILEMIAAVSESDQEIDLAEDRYLRRAAVAMGMAEKEFRDLIVDFQEVDDLEGILSETLGI